MRRPLLETSRVAAGLLLITAAFGACKQMGPARTDAPADSAAGEVAFEMVGMNDAAIVVPVHINGAGPFDFVLDTGATVTCIDRALADSLGLPAIEGVIGLGAGAAGSGQLRLVELDSVRVGNARAEALSGCTLDLAHLTNIGLPARGLIGLNFLKSFRVSLDFGRSVLILQSSGHAANRGTR